MTAVASGMFRWLNPTMTADGPIVLFTFGSLAPCGYQTDAHCSPVSMFAGSLCDAR